MVRILGAFLLATAATAAHAPRRANFVHISITASSTASVRAIWRPYAGAVGSTGQEQQDALQRRRQFRNVPDSVRHWEDPAARDTIVLKTPTEVVVDMNGGPIVIELTAGDSVHVEAQLTPARGPVVASWGRAFIIESDGRTPYVERRR
jgi:hypothetical protein